LTEHMLPGNKIAALFPYDRYVPPRVRVFIDYLASAVKADNRFHTKLPASAIV